MSSWNPYEQWLEIRYDGTVPSYYEMIGVATDEVDLAVIEAAADRALARVRACLPGAQAASWTQLLDQLNDAKACLTDSAARVTYDQLLVDGAVPHKDLAQPATDIDSVDGSSVLPAVPVSPLPQPIEAGQLDAAVIGMVEDDPFAPSHLATDSTPLPVGREVATHDAPVASADLPFATGAESTADTIAAGRSDSQRNLLIMVAGSVFLIGALSITYYLAGNRNNEVARKGNQRPSTVKKEDPVRQNARPTPPPVPRPTPQPVPRPTPEPVDPPQPPPPLPMPTPPPTPPKPTPIPVPPTPDPESKPLTAPEKAQLAAAFKMVRTALSERNFSVAAEQMKIADGLARTPEFEAMYLRLNLLVKYTMSFDRLLKKSLSEMQAGTELKIGTSTLAAVVEVTEERITLKVAGVLKRYPVEEMSKGLVLGIAQTKFDMQRSGSVMAVGTYLATRKGSTDADRQKARDLWQQAVGMGSQIGDLAEVLNDTYDFMKEPE